MPSSVLILVHTSVPLARKSTSISSESSSFVPHSADPEADTDSLGPVSQNITSSLPFSANSHCSEERCPRLEWRPFSNTIKAHIFQKSTVLDEY